MMIKMATYTNHEGNIYVVLAPGMYQVDVSQYQYNVYAILFAMISQSDSLLEYQNPYQIHVHCH